MGPLLSKIKSPADLHKLSLEEMRGLAEEMRDLIKETVAGNSGHLSSNLGVVELAIALHRCFDFLKDRLVWDVGHQAYAHKMITGRAATFSTLRTFGGLSGFPSKDESPYDLFTTGHAGTAISCALGLAAAGALCSNPARVVAVVGDGAIGTGMSFEALNHAGHLKTNLLVVLNDNSMSISSTVGGLSNYLNKVRVGVTYNEFKREIQRLLESIPILGEKMRLVFEHVKDGVKRSMMAGQLFEDLGFRYFGPIDGHNIELLIDTLNRIKLFEGPLLLHVVTQKGHGFPPACEDPETFHSPKPFCTDTGQSMVPAGGPARKTYTDFFKEELIELARADGRIVAITAAMPDGTGVSAFAEKFPKRYFDVGICEQHALGLAAGLARGGRRPVVAVYSTFLQRGFDQAFHELCLQGLPIVLALDRAGLVGSDGPTHHGAYDIAYLRCLPRMVLMAPADGAELRQMLRLALTASGPVAIRYPRTVPEAIPRSGPAPDFGIGQAEVLRNGPDGALVAYGAMVMPALAAAERLAQRDIYVTVVNARFAKPLDHTVLSRVLREMPLVVTVEEHICVGGFGSALLEMAAAEGLETGRIACLAIPDRFIEHGPRDLLLKSLDLDADGIARRFLELREDVLRRDRPSAAGAEMASNDPRIGQRSP